jgi:ABC-type antimicrobial peptide transport system permease subunit
LVGGEWATMELCCVLVRFGLAWFGLGRWCSKWVEAESLLSERKGRRGEGGRRE